MSESPARTRCRGVKRDPVFEVAAIPDADWRVRLGSGSEGPLEHSFQVIGPFAHDCYKTFRPRFVLECNAGALPDRRLDEKRG